VLYSWVLLPGSLSFLVFNLSLPSNSPTLPSVQLFPHTAVFAVSATELNAIVPFSPWGAKSGPGSCCPRCHIVFHSWTDFCLGLMGASPQTLGVIVQTVQLTGLQLSSPTATNWTKFPGLPVSNPAGMGLFVFSQMSFVPHLQKSWCATSNSS
jgi:hypothetical protein